MILLGSNWFLTEGVVSVTPCQIWHSAHTFIQLSPNLKTVTNPTLMNLIYEGELLSFICLPFSTNLSHTQPESQLFFRQVFYKMKNLLPLFLILYDHHLCLEL